MFSKRWYSQIGSFHSIWVYANKTLKPANFTWPPWNHQSDECRKRALQGIILCFSKEMKGSMLMISMVYLQNWVGNSRHGYHQTETSLRNVPSQITQDWKFEKGLQPQFCLKTLRDHVSVGEDWLNGSESSLETRPAKGGNMVWLCYSATSLNMPDIWLKTPRETFDFIGVESMIGLLFFSGFLLFPSSTLQQFSRQKWLSLIWELYSS